MDGRLVRPLPRGRQLTARRSFELAIHPRIRDIPQETWDALAGKDASPFVEWTWLECLEEAGCVGRGTGWQPAHLALSEDKRLLAIAPAYAKGNSEGEFVFDWSWADASHRVGVPYYPKLILAVPFTPATGARLMVDPGIDREETTQAVAAAIRKWSGDEGLSGFHALFVREDEAAAWRGAGMLERYGVQYHWTRQGAATFEDFLGRFNSKRRNQIRREVAQPAKDGVTIETLGPGDLDAPTVRAMYELYAANVDRHYYGRHYLNLRFFELVAERYADRLAWVVARKDGRIVAGAFNVRKGNRLYGRYWGTTIDLPFLHFNVCYYHGVRYCLEQGIEAFEPGAGGEHKKARGFEPTLMRSMHWIADRRLRSAIDGFLEREREAISAYVAEG